MRNFIIYRHISPSNKVYIGITCMKPEYRWNNGNGYPHNKYFSAAIEKYGWENFKHEILFEGLTEGEASAKETEFIRLHHSNDRKYGYNLSSGGECGFFGCKRSGYIRTEEHRRKMSESCKGKTFSDEHRRKISESLKGKPLSDKTKRKMSESRKRISSEYKKYKENGGTMKWHEFLKNYKNI